MLMITAVAENNAEVLLSKAICQLKTLTNVSVISPPAGDYDPIPKPVWNPAELFHEPCDSDTEKFVDKRDEDQRT